jgi:predicted enzyme related to lactoylglutathione lyase
MHKSRLGVIVIDCKSDDLSESEAFWSQALGCPVQRSEVPEHQNYAKLETPDRSVAVLLQKVDHESRVHLDIESDDIEAEVQRLEKLGAKRVKQLPRWWVMQAPSGHRFCVVAPQRDNFDEEANQWD